MRRAITSQHLSMNYAHDIPHAADTHQDPHGTHTESATVDRHVRDNEGKDSA